MLRNVDLPLLVNPESSFQEPSLAFGAASAWVALGCFASWPGFSGSLSAVRCRCVPAAKSSVI